MHTGRCAFLMAEDRGNILNGHKANLSGHRTRQNEKPHPVFTQGTHRKVCLNRGPSDENRELTNLVDWLEKQADGSYACVLPFGVFFPYDKWHNRQRQRKTATISGRKRINKNQEYSCQIFTKVTIPKELVTQIFFSCYSKFRKGKKRFSPLLLPLVPVGRDPEG